VVIDVDSVALGEPHCTFRWSGGCCTLTFLLLMGLTLVCWTTPVLIKVAHPYCLVITWDPFAKCKKPQCPCLDEVVRKEDAINWILSPVVCVQSLCPMLQDNSESPMCWNVESIGSSLMSLLMSASMITIMPFICQVSTCTLRSSRIWCKGHIFSLSCKPSYALLIHCQVAVCFTGLINWYHSKEMILFSAKPSSTPSA